MTKKVLALLLGLAMILGLAACGSTAPAAPATTAAPETEAATEAATEAETEEETTTEEETEKETAELKGTIKVGHLVDLTGVEAVTGELAKESFDFAAEYVRALTGWEFEIVDADCAGEAEKAATNAESLISQGCKAIFGPTQIMEKKSVLAYVADNHCPVVLYNGSPAAFTGGMLFGNDTIVANGGGTASLPTVMADYLFNEVGLRTVYCFKQDSVGGNNYVDPFKTCFEAMGGTVIDNIPVAAGTNDWSGYLTTIMNSDAEAIVGWTSSSDAIAFFKEWYNSGAYEKLPVYATMHGGFADSYIMDQLDDKIVDALLNPATNDFGLTAPICYSYTVDTPENQDFVAAYEEEFDEVPLGNNLPGATVQALLALAYALDEVGPEADADTLAAAIRATEFDGPEGHTVYEEGSVVAIKDVYVCETTKLDDGSINYVVKKAYKQVPNAGYNFDGTNYTGQ